MLRTTDHLKLYNTDMCYPEYPTVTLAFCFCFDQFALLLQECEISATSNVMTYCSVDVLVDQKFTFTVYLEAFSWLPFQLCIIKGGFSLMELWSTTVSLKLRVISDVIGL